MGRTLPRGNELAWSNDALRALHAAMLSRLPLTAVKDFWQKCPAPTASSLSDTLEHVWREGGQSSIEYIAGTFNRLESFLLDNGFDVTNFIRDALGGLGRGLYQMPRTMLAGAEPIMSKLFGEGDLRDVILDHIHLSGERTLPGALLRQVKRTSADGWSTSIVAMAIDKNFGGAAPVMDADLFVALPLSLAPVPVGLPAFEHARALSDCRPPLEVVDNPEATLVEGVLRIGDALHGRTTGFHEFCTGLGIDAAGRGLPDGKVLVAARDHRCPRRKRVVLREGCAYGAPVALVELRYKRAVRRPGNPLARIIGELTSGETAAWQHAALLHQKLLDIARGRHTFVYRGARGSISVDGRHLASKVPARILRNILRGYSAHGQTEFEHRQFVEDSEIVRDPANPNFAVRVQRLMHVLETKTPDVRLERTGRGSFTLRSDAEIVYREE